MQLLPLLKKSKSVLIVCHKRPDGDCLGSGLALFHLCGFLGIAADVVADSDLPDKYAFMPGFEHLNLQKNKKYDLTIAVDCAETARMGKFADYAVSTESVNIDHHKTNEYFCKHNVVIGELSSTCELLYDILAAEGIFDMGIPAHVIQKIGACLYTGLSTDTGHFMHSSVTAKTMAAAAALAEMGIDLHAIALNLYRSNSKNRTVLLARSILNMRFFRDDSICVITVFLKDLSETGCVPADTEGLIDAANDLKDTRVAVLIAEHSDQLFKVSFRSKKIDVSRVAAVFGGGGHARAAGCAVAGYYEDTVDKLVKAVSDGLDAENTIAESI